MVPLVKGINNILSSQENHRGNFGFFVLFCLQKTRSSSCAVHVNFLAPTQVLTHPAGDASLSQAALVFPDRGTPAEAKATTGLDIGTAAWIFLNACVLGSTSWLWF